MGGCGQHRTWRHWLVAAVAKLPRRNGVNSAQGLMFQNRSHEQFCNPIGGGQARQASSCCQEVLTMERDPPHRSIMRRHAGGAGRLSSRFRCQWGIPGSWFQQVQPDWHRNMKERTQRAPGHAARHPRPGSGQPGLLAPFQIDNLSQVSPKTLQTNFAAGCTSAIDLAHAPRYKLGGPLTCKHESLLVYSELRGPGVCFLVLGPPAAKPA